MGEEETDKELSRDFFILHTFNKTLETIPGSFKHIEPWEPWNLVGFGFAQNLPGGLTDIQISWKL